MRMGRVAMPLIKQYMMPVDNEFGNNISSTFVPESTNVISGKNEQAQYFAKHSKRLLRKPEHPPLPHYQKGQKQACLKLHEQMARRGGLLATARADGRRR